jgi:xanthosine utilization system XapX-like protein
MNLYIVSKIAGITDDVFNVLEGVCSPVLPAIALLDLTKIPISERVGPVAVHLLAGGGVPEALILSGSSVSMMTLLLSNAISTMRNISHYR